MNALKFCFVVCFLLSCVPSSLGESLLLHDAQVELYFSPKGGAEAAIVQAIGTAKQEVCVQAFGFTSAPIAEALVLPT